MRALPLSVLVLAVLLAVQFDPWARAGAQGRPRGDTLDRARSAGELRWGGDLQGGEPFVYEDPRDPSHLVGFEVEIADDLARHLGLKRARFVQVDWSSLVATLERGDVDVVLNGLEETPERRARLRLSRPYFVFEEVLAVRRGAPFRTFADLRHKRVATLNQTYAFDWLRSQPVETVLYEGQQEPYFDLQQGRVDAVLLDDVISQRYGCILSEVICLPGAIARGTYVIAVRKDDERLGRAIDEGLGKMIEEGELYSILQRWNLWNSSQSALQSGSVPGLPPATLQAVDSLQLRLFLDGAAVTVVLSLGAFAIAMPLGALLAALRLSAGRGVGTLVAAYVELFRGTPVLLQLYVLYFGLAPVLKLGPTTAAILGLGMNYAAYEAEVYRGAMLAVPRGQSDAAAALGFGPWSTMRHVVFPQAMRMALPAITNDFVSLLKDSSLVSVLTVVELTKRMTIAAAETRSWLGPGVLCAAFYFAMSFPLSRLSRRLEQRLPHDPHPRLA